MKHLHQVFRRLISVNQQINLRLYFRKSSGTYKQKIKTPVILTVDEITNSLTLHLSPLKTCILSLIRAIFCSCRGTDTINPKAVF